MQRFKSFMWSALFLVGLQLLGTTVIGELYAQSNVDVIEIELEQIVNIGGTLGEVLVRPPFVYAGRGENFEIIDFSVPEQPTLGGTIPINGPISDIQLDGDTAYVLVGDNQIQIIDVSDPTVPRLLNQYYLPGGQNSTSGQPASVSATFSEYAVSDGMIYAATGIGGLVAIDARVPQQLIERDRFAIASSYLTESTARVTLVDKSLYTIFVRNNQPVLRIFDISNPVRLNFTGSLTFPSMASIYPNAPLLVQGDSAFYTVGTQLYLVDISDPLRPRLQGTYNSTHTDSLLNLQIVANDKAFLSSTPFEGDVSALDFVDISDATSPTLYHTEFFTGTSGLGSVQADSDRLYVNLAAPQSSLHIFDTSTTDQVSATQHLEGIGPNASVVNGQLYDVKPASLRVLELADDAEPLPIGEYMVSGSAAMVAVHENLAYVFYLSNDQNQGRTVEVQLMEISTLDAPSEVGRIRVPGGTGHMESNDLTAWKGAIAFGTDRLFLAGHDSGIHIIDISTPDAPTLISTFRDTTAGLVDSVEGLASAGDTLYVAGGTTGLHVLNVQDPQNPSIVGTIDTIDSALDVAVIDDELFVAADGAGVARFDISTPNDPQLLQTVQLEYPIAKIIASQTDQLGHRLYMLPSIEGSTPFAFFAQIADLNVAEPFAALHTINNSAGFFPSSGDSFEGNAYFLEASGSLTVLNTENLDNVYQTSRLFLPTASPLSPSVAVIDDAVLIAGQSAGLYVFKQTNFALTRFPLVAKMQEPGPFTEPDPSPFRFRHLGPVLCEPQRAGSWVHGRVYDRRNEPTNDAIAVFSYEPDGPHIARAQIGPHPGYGWADGYFSHILGTNGSREGDWYFWLVDASLQRISEIVYIHTDGPDSDGSCSQAQITFYEAN